jgi:hypothetical protein
MSLVGWAWSGEIVEVEKFIFYKSFTDSLGIGALFGV